MKTLLAALAIVAITQTAYAHKAASGMEFPIACCRGSDVGGDCHSISADDVKLESDGSYLIKATGERFVSPGTEQKGERAYRWSNDGMYYRCNMDPKNPLSITYCLFIPSPGA